MVGIVEQLDVGRYATRISLVTYSTQSRIEFSLDSYNEKMDIITAIRNTRYVGQEANLSGGLRTMHYNVFTASTERAGVQKIAVVLLDGPLTVQVGQEAREAQDAQRDDITIYSIGVSSRVDANLIEDITSPPKKQSAQYYFPIEFVALRQQVTPNLVSYLLGRVPSVPVPDTSCMYSDVGILIQMHLL